MKAPRRRAGPPPRGVSQPLVQDSGSGMGLPDWLDLSGLLEWTQESFQEHMASLNGVAERLGDVDNVEALSDSLLADPREEVRCLAFDLLAAAIALYGRALVPTLIEASMAVKTQGGAELRWSVAHALASTNDERVLDEILSFAHDSDSDVRWQVAAGIPTALAPFPPKVISALLALATDEDADVRDWATFTLGVQSDADSPAIRDALAERLDDSDATTAGEAAVGLASRADPRALPAVRRRLALNDPGNLFVEAAMVLAEPSLAPLLEALKSAGWAESNPRGYLLDQALEACGRS